MALAAERRRPSESSGGGEVDMASPFTVDVGSSTVTYHVESSLRGLHARLDDVDFVDKRHFAGNAGRAVGGAG